MGFVRNNLLCMGPILQKERLTTLPDHAAAIAASVRPGCDPGLRAQRLVRASKRMLPSFLREVGGRAFKFGLFSVGCKQSPVSRLSRMGFLRNNSLSMGPILQKERLTALPDHAAAIAASVRPGCDPGLRAQRLGPLDVLAKACGAAASGFCFAHCGVRVQHDVSEHVACRGQAFGALVPVGWLSKSHSLGRGSMTLQGLSPRFLSSLWLNRFHGPDSSK